MTEIFLKEIDKLKRMVLRLGETVEQAVVRAVRSVERGDADLAQAVIAGDRAIDDMEVEVEEECLKILALHQPVAIDLRFIVAVLKMNSDLERVGDKAASIAKKGMRFHAGGKREIPLDLHGMAERVLAMLRKSMGALVNLERATAEEVCRSDQEINAEDEKNVALLRGLVPSHPEATNAMGLMIEISSALERIADHATNIAEDVIYMIDGTIVRHRVANGQTHPNRRATDQ